MLATGDDLKASSRASLMSGASFNVIGPHRQENRPVVHAVEIDAGFENVGVARQTHGGQKSAVGSAPETDPLRINVVECLQKFRARDHVLVFGCAAPHRFWRLAKGAPVHDAEPVIHREHGVTFARQILIHRIGVVVILHVMKPEQHLPDRSAVREDESGAAFRFVLWREQLAVNFEAVLAFKHHLLWRD